MYLEADGRKNPIGVAFFIEVKSATGRLSSGQEEQLKQLRATGAVAIVARGLDEVRNVINLYANKSLLRLLPSV